MDMKFWILLIDELLHIFSDHSIIKISGLSRLTEGRNGLVLYTILKIIITQDKTFCSFRNEKCQYGLAIDTYYYTVSHISMP